MPGIIPSWLFRLINRLIVGEGGTEWRIAAAGRVHRDDAAGLAVPVVGGRD